MNGTESCNVYQRKKNKEENTENCESKSLYYPKQLQEFLTFKNDLIALLIQKKYQIQKK